MRETLLEYLPLFDCLIALLPADDIAASYFRSVTAFICGNYQNYLSETERLYATKSAVAQPGPTVPAFRTVRVPPRANPADGENWFGGVTFELPKKWVKIRSPRKLFPTQLEVLVRMNEKRHGNGNA